eukprot:4097434-Prymnesium_polylepis.1
MVHYADAGAAADDDARFALRGAHALGFDNDQERSGFTALIQHTPETAAGQDGLDGGGVKHITMAEVTLRKVQTSHAVRALTPVAAYITDAAWTRWFNTQKGMINRKEPTRRAGTYADYV